MGHAREGILGLYGLVRLGREWEECKGELPYRAFWLKGYGVSDIVWLKLYRARSESGKEFFGEGNFSHDDEWGYCR